ncbi:MAG: LptF/LptG family permease [Bacteroidota bacterium]
MNRLHVLISGTFLRYFLLLTVILVVLLVMDAFAMHFSSLLQTAMSGSQLRALLVLGIAKVFPVVLPLAILAASLLTTSSLTESHELYAIEGLGIPLPRLSVPLLVFSLLAALLSAYGTFSWVPRQNLKLKVLMYELMYNQPDMNIRPGYFWNEIEGISMRVGARKKESPLLYDVLLYQYGEEQEANAIIVADSARMQLSPSKKYISLFFFHGNRQEEYQETNEELKHYPFGRIYFDTLQYRFPIDYLSAEEVAARLTDQNSLEREDLEHKLGQLSKQKEKVKEEDLRKEIFKRYRRHKYAFAEMHILPLLNIVFMMLGLGLGSLTRIRSQGVAFPALMAVGLFAVFYLLKVQGGRLGYKGVIDSWWAAMLPLVVFLPLSVWLFLRSRR